MDISVEDLITRKSYEHDTVFRVIDVNETVRETLMEQADEQKAYAFRLFKQDYQHLDQLVIFAWACQSHFQLLIRAGANFVSSPERVNIHALDPVYIAAKVCYTSFMDRVTPEDLIRHTLTKQDGIGGIETRGFFGQVCP